MIPTVAEGILKYPVVLLVGFLACYLLTPPVQRLARALGWVDKPRGRHIHDKSVPRCGLSVFLAFHIACAAVYVLPWEPFRQDLTPLWWWHYLILSSLLLLVGLADDRWDLRPTWKLAGQVIVALLAFTFDMRVGRLLGTELPMAVDVVVTVIWFVGIINAFNLIDGIDGLATGLTGIAAVGIAGSFMFRHLPGDALLLAGLVGVCLAFLRFNFQPASIFLGDSGSMFFGFTIAAIAVGTGAKGTAVASIVVPLLAVGVPLFDTFLAIWRRGVRRILNRGESRGIFKGDLDHVHHRLLRTGLSHRGVATWLYTASAALMSIGLLSMLYRSHALGIYILAFVITTYVIVRHIARIELWDSGRAIINGLERPPHRALGLLVYPLLDVTLLSVALAAAILLSETRAPDIRFRLHWFDRIPLWVGLPILAIVATKAYQRLWRKARVSEYVLLAGATLAGILLASGIASFIHPVPLRNLLLMVIVYAGLGLPAIVAIRVFPRAVEDSMVWTRRADGYVPQPNHTLVYGTGTPCSLFLQEASRELIEGRHQSHVVGLLDSDRTFKGRYAHGFPILGTADDVADLIPRHHVETIVLTEELPRDETEPLCRLAAEHGVSVCERRIVVTMLTGPSSSESDS